MKPKKWMPKIGEKYYRIILSSTLWVCDGERDEDMLERYYKINCFKTKKLALEAARKMARKIREVLS